MELRSDDSLLLVALTLFLSLLSVLSTGLAILGPALMSRRRLHRQSRESAVEEHRNYKTMEGHQAPSNRNREATMRTYQFIQALVDHLAQYLFLIFVLDATLRKHKSIVLLDDSLFLASCTLILSAKALLPLFSTVASCLSVLLTDVGEGGLLDTQYLTTTLYVFPAISLAVVLAGASYALQADGVPNDSAARLLIVTLTVTTALSTLCISVLLYILICKVQGLAVPSSNPSCSSNCTDRAVNSQSTPTKSRARHHFTRVAPGMVGVNATTNADSDTSKTEDITADGSSLLTQPDKQTFPDASDLHRQGDRDTLAHTGTPTEETLMSFENRFAFSTGSAEHDKDAGSGLHPVTSSSMVFGRFRNHLSVGRGYLDSSLNPRRPALAIGTGGTGSSLVSNGTKASSENPFKTSVLSSHQGSLTSSSARFGSRSTAHTLASSNLNASAYSSSSSASQAAVKSSSVRQVALYRPFDGQEYEGDLLRPENIIGEESLEDVIQQSLAYLEPPIHSTTATEAAAQSLRHSHNDSSPKMLLVGAQASRSPSPGLSSYEQQDDSSSVVLISRPASLKSTSRYAVDHSNSSSFFQRIWLRRTLSHVSGDNECRLPFPRLLDTFGIAFLVRMQIGPGSKAQLNERQEGEGIDPCIDARLRLSILCISLWLSFVRRFREAGQNCLFLTKRDFSPLSQQILALPLLCSVVSKGKDAKPSLGAFLCMILGVSLTGEPPHSYRPPEFKRGWTDRACIRQVRYWLCKSSYPSV